MGSWLEVDGVRGSGGCGRETAPGRTEGGLSLGPSGPGGKCAADQPSPTAAGAAGAAVSEAGMGSTSGSRG